MTILNSEECNQFYHKFSKVPSLVQIVDSQMVCTKDFEREQFCYVSAPLLCSLTSTGARPGVVLGYRAAGMEGEGGAWRER